MFGGGCEWCVLRVSMVVSGICLRRVIWLQRRCKGLESGFRQVITSWTICSKMSWFLGRITYIGCVNLGLRKRRLLYGAPNASSEETLTKFVSSVIPCYLDKEQFWEMWFVLSERLTLFKHTQLIIQSRDGVLSFL